MSRWRWVLAMGVVAALAVALVVLSTFGDEPVVTTTTTGLAVTTTTEPSNTTVTSAPSTTTTSAEQRQAEVEELLQDLWFGWFDAIYRKDPDALWKVVATTKFHDSGLAAMGTAEFEDAPTRIGVVITDLRILLDRPDCLVVEHSVDISQFKGPGSASSAVSVLWPDDRYGFRFATDWRFANDLWQMDCDNLEREVTP